MSWAGVWALRKFFPSLLSSPRCWMGRIAVFGANVVQAPAFGEGVRLAVQG